MGSADQVTITIKLIRQIYVALLKKEFAIAAIKYDHKGFITYLKLGLK